MIAITLNETDYELNLSDTTASRWILKTGYWNDDGVWDDDEYWIDSGFHLLGVMIELTWTETEYEITVTDGQKTPVPENAVLNADGQPLSNADGSYILTD
jgi:hypothetical protein